MSDPGASLNETILQPEVTRATIDFYSEQMNQIGSGLGQLTVESIVFGTYISLNTLRNALIDTT